ncbi:TLC domain-containing protein 4-B-like [Styela clava]
MSTELVIAAGFYAIYQLLFRAISPGFCRRFVNGYEHFSKEQKIKIDSGNSSLCNTVVVYILSFVIVFGSSSVQQWQWGDLTLTSIYICNSISYFISDLHVMTEYRKEINTLPSVYVHHMICIIACYYVLRHEIFLYYLIFRNLSEIVQPFFHVRYYFRCLELSNTKVDQLAGVGLTISFFISRIILVPLFWIQFTSDENVDEFYNNNSKLGPVLLSVSCIGLDLLNVYWFGRIAAAWLRFFRLSKFD